MTLDELLVRLPVAPIAVRGGGVAVSRLTADSRRVRAGDLFAAMPSARLDTAAFLAPARAGGAAAALVASENAWRVAEGLDLPAAWLPTDGHAFNVAVGHAVRELTDDPTAGRTVIGVTGTNGKTTTAWILAHALRAAGTPAAYLGTLGFQCGDGAPEPLANTTPFPAELGDLLARAASAGAQAVAMEASSHALEERRLAGVRFDVGVFTNLTQDHLDYHGTMERYAAAKRLLFTEMAQAGGKPFTAVLNVDDPVGRAWAADAATAVSTYGRKTAEADVRAEVQRIAVDGLELLVREAGGTPVRLAMGLGGTFNVENALAAYTALRACGMAPADAAEALRGVPPVPGRFEPVPNPHGIGVLVDYAHTPDALAKVLSSARAVTRGRLICVFGCGGDRDRTKRPLMAAAVAAGADFAILTSDNPRTEDPLAILRDIEAGLPSGTSWAAVLDRPAAVARAIDLAQAGDTVVVAGKGHEDYQIVGTVKHPMDDRDLARRALARRGASERAGGEA